MYGAFDNIYNGDWGIGIRLCIWTLSTVDWADFEPRTVHRIDPPLLSCIVTVCVPAPTEFGEYWDSFNLFEAYMDRFEDDIALAASMVLWTLSIREFSEWDMKIQ
jgi:peptidoglycan/LPS O-acetylase OafA/YrhL